MAKQIETGNIAMFIDSRSIFFKGCDILVGDLEEVAKQYGEIKTRRIYFDPYIEEFDKTGEVYDRLRTKINHFLMGGYHIRSNLYGDSEFPADGFLIAECVETAIKENGINYIVIASRDGHYAGAGEVIRKHGKKLVSIGTEFPANCIVPFGGWGNEQILGNIHTDKGYTTSSLKKEQRMARYLVTGSDFCEIIEPKLEIGIDVAKYEVLDVFETRNKLKSFLVKLKPNTARK